MSAAAVLNDLQIRLRLPRADFALDIDLRLPAHGISVLFGASGSGKTSVLRCVAGLEQASQARVAVGTEVWQDAPRGIFVPTWRRPVGYVFQEASLFEHLDVQGNLQFGLKRSKDPAAACALQAAIELLGIGALLHRRTAQLSGGERQRVAIARALATQPRLLLLDEPLAALDHARRQEVLPWLERLRDELHIPMLYVTHSVEEVARLADTLVLLERGKVLACGPVAEVLGGGGSDVGAALGLQSARLLGDDMGALLHATVAERDARWQLLRLDFDGGSLWLRDTGLALGRSVRLRVLARDVSIALEQPRHTSIQNQLTCTVLTIADDAHASQQRVHLQCGSATLLARVTARAVDTLALAPGQQVWAQVKSVALVE